MYFNFIFLYIVLYILCFIRTLIHDILHNVACVSWDLKNKWLFNTIIEPYDSWRSHILKVKVIAMVTKRVIVMDTVDKNGQMELNAIWTDEVKEKIKQTFY